MSLGELIASMVAHSIFILVLAEFNNYLYDYDRTISHMISTKQNNFLLNFCKKDEFIVSNYGFKCTISLKWKEENHFISICETFSKNKTYPIRWYLIEGKCRIRMNNLENVYLVNRVKIKA